MAHPNEAPAKRTLLRRAFSWLYRRWGQLICFGWGLSLLQLGTQGYVDSLPVVIAGAALLGLGAALRAMAIWRETRLAESAPRP